MAKQAVARTRVDLEPIDRLEEKIKRLVDDGGAAARRAGAEPQDENARLGAGNRRAARASGRCRRRQRRARSRCATSATSSARASPRCCSSSKPSECLAVADGPQNEQRGHRRDRRPAISDPQRSRRAVRRGARRVRRSEDARGLDRRSDQRHARPRRPGRAEHRRRVLPRAPAAVRPPAASSTSAPCGSSGSSTTSSRR